MFRTRLLRTSRQALGLNLRASANGSALNGSFNTVVNHNNKSSSGFSARRSLHSVPLLPHDYSQGVPNLMSPGGFALAWTDYMTVTLDKLNAMIAGTELEAHDVKTILLMTAREPNQAPIFNHASMAHNNHFFFQGIAPEGTPMPDDLRRELEASFSSIDSLRLEFIVTASAMFGPGFVWLVKAGPGDYRILPTYLAGSPYPGAHWRMQSTDMNTVGNDGSARPYLRNQLLGAGRRRTGELPPGGIELEPLLCLNTWEHAWLLDWGMGVDGKGGKAAYVDAWWNAVDWEKVHQRAGVTRPEFMTENSP
ncbi:Fe superoxide dismutase [Trichoderma citrinoviride]|uniref:Fe superoxide dismutase n=1 Tax=Trichoderma citrinoviride TaxID=58853 RepID=A0A2T4B863_9HYPO|nr:Fe superoxide dismutase [Trichoderma citrinoviride]PTB65411.1 Fe superoxide dismutase [Trichoderma citrinoviride]